LVLPPNAGLIEVSTGSTNVHTEAGPFYCNRKVGPKKIRTDQKSGKNMFFKSRILMRRFGVKMPN